MKNSSLSLTWGNHSQFKKKEAIPGINTAEKELETSFRTYPGMLRLKLNPLIFIINQQETRLLSETLSPSIMQTEQSLHLPVQWYFNRQNWWSRGKIWKVKLMYWWIIVIINQQETRLLSEILPLKTKCKLHSSTHLAIFYQQKWWSRRKLH